MQHVKYEIFVVIIFSIMQKKKKKEKKNQSLLFYFFKAINYFYLFIFKKPHFLKFQNRKLKDI